MHEYSIVQALLNQCEDIAKENRATKVTKVKCKIGVMSGIEIHLLQTAFDTFKEKTICQEAELTIDHQKIKIKCHSCQSECTIDKAQYACPSCQSQNVEVTDGEDMYLMSLEME